MARRHLNHGQATDRADEQNSVTDDAEFALDWIDGRIGQDEYRHALIVYGGPVFLDCTQPQRNEMFECAIRDFRIHTSHTEASTNADFLRFESDAVMLGWHSFNRNEFAQAANAALQLAAWQHKTLAASCVISVGRVLVSNYQKVWSDYANLLSGDLFARMRSVQTRTAAGRVAASYTFAMLCAGFDIVKLANFGFKCSFDNRSDFLELQPIGNELKNEAAWRVVTASPLAVNTKQELIGEKYFFSLGRSRRLLSVAAVIGRTFDCELLARCLSMEPNHIIGIINQLKYMAVIENVQNTEFRITDKNLYEASYLALPVRSRTWLHEQIAHCLILRRSDRNIDTQLTAIIAWHFAQSGKALETGAWSRTAAMDAVVHSTPDRAIACLRLAYESLRNSNKTVPISEWVGLCRLLGTQLATVHGNASPKVLEAYRHGLAAINSNIAQACETEFDAIWGLAGYHLTRGELTKARLASRNLITIAEHQKDNDKQVLALRMAGLTELLLGNLHSAIFNLRMCVTIYNPSRHHALRYQYGSDQLALAHAHLAWAQAFTANSILSRKHADLARRQANNLQHAHTNAHVAGVLSLVYEMEGQLREARAMDLACATLSVHYKFPYWEAWSDIVRSSLSMRNDPKQAIVNLYKSIEKYQKTGAKQLLPWAFARTAKAHLILGNIEQAQLQVECGLKALTETEIRIFEPELRFWEAQCLMRQGKSTTAELTLKKYSTLAQRMQVKNILRDEFYPPGITI